MISLAGVWRFENLKSGGLFESLTEAWPQEGGPSISCEVILVLQGEKVRLRGVKENYEIIRSDYSAVLYNLLTQDLIYT